MNSISLNLNKLTSLNSYFYLDPLLSNFKREGEEGLFRIKSSS